MLFLNFRNRVIELPPKYKKSSRLFKNKFRRKKNRKRFLRFKLIKVKKYFQKKKIVGICLSWRPVTDIILARLIFPEDRIIRVLIRNKTFIRRRNTTGRRKKINPQRRLYFGLFKDAFYYKCDGFSASEDPITIKKMTSPYWNSERIIGLIYLIFVLIFFRYGHPDTWNVITTFMKNNANAIILIVKKLLKF